MFLVLEQCPSKHPTVSDACNKLFLFSRPISNFGTNANQLISQQAAVQGLEKSVQAAGGKKQRNLT